MFGMLRNPGEAGSLAPIAVEILFVELAEQKDWNGKRGVCFQITLSFRY